MEVQISTGQPFLYHAGDKVPQCPYRGDVILATDPGKTNMAVTVGTVFGVPLLILQFRAPGYANNNSEYCHDFKAFLKEYLKDCHVVCFAIEEAISKKGMNFHRSSMVLTEIRANLIDLSYSLTGREAFQVNNWAWKYAILPDGMRSQSEKGSTRYLPDLFRIYGNADVTDSVCIYKYAVQKVGDMMYTICPTEPETTLFPYHIMIVPGGTGARKKARRFVYNECLSLIENISYAINRTTETVYAEVPISALTLEDIYQYSRRFSLGAETGRVEVVVLRY